MLIVGSRPDTLSKKQIAVGSEHDMVVIKVGNIRWKMKYEDALLLSQWIRIRAKEAKRRAGDISRHWSAIGIMHDANYGPDHTGNHDKKYF